MKPNPEFESSEEIELDKDPEKAMKQVADILEKRYKDQFLPKHGLPSFHELFCSTIDELDKMDLPDPFEITDTEVDEKTGRVDFTIKGSAEWIDMMRPIVEKCNAEELERRKGNDENKMET